MPNWKVHLELGKRLNKYFNYNEEDLNLFLLGSILPDINNCYIVTDIEKQINHDITHFGGWRESNYINFYEEYKNEIDNRNPLLNGYLAHLFTDYMWNKTFYNKIQNLEGLPENHNEIRKMKQSDFKLYNNKFIENTIQMNNINTALEEIKKIKEVAITKGDILKVIDFLNNQKIYEGEFKFHTIEELDKLMNNTIIEYVTEFKS